MKNLLSYSILPLLLPVLVLLNCAMIFAHGENQLGPHGGMIRMPGAFHTELVKNASNSPSKFFIAIYLLDMSLKNPVIKNSTVTVNFVMAAKSSMLKFSCNPVEKENLFNCEIMHNIKDLKELQIIATRNGVKASQLAIYTKDELLH